MLKTSPLSDLHRSLHESLSTRIYFIIIRASEERQLYFRLYNTPSINVYRAAWHWAFFSCPICKKCPVLNAQDYWIHLWAIFIYLHHIWFLFNAWRGFNFRLNWLRHSRVWCGSYFGSDIYLVIFCAWNLLYVNKLEFLHYLPGLPQVRLRASLKGSINFTLQIFICLPMWQIDEWKKNYSPKDSSNRNELILF